MSHLIFDRTMWCGRQHSGALLSVIEVSGRSVKIGDAQTLMPFCGRLPRCGRMKQVERDRQLFRAV